MNTKGKRNLLKRIMALAVAVVMALGLVPCMSIKTSAEGGTSAKNDTGKWVTNSDGTLSIDDTAAKNAVSTVEGNVSMVLIGTIGGEITLPAVDATTKVSKKKDAALVLYDPKVSKETVSDMLQQIKFSASTTSVNIAVTDGDTTIKVSSDDATFGIMGNNGEAHIYKYVTTTKTWIGAFHDAVTATDTLGGFKGYLATVTTQEEADLLFEFYTSTNPGNTNGGWIAATSLSYTKDKNATSYSQVKNSRMSPSNYENITSINKQTVGDMYKIEGTDGAYYWSQTSYGGGYGNEFYWACGPEMGEAVPTELWNANEPNNSGGECSTVASYSGKARFNDFQPAQTVSGYFLEFSVYEDGLANENVKYKSTTIYRVSYAENGATGGTVPNVQAKFLNQALTLATNTGNLTRGEGLGFNGWNTQADGKGTHYDAGATYAAGNNASLTLYAEWVNNPAKPPTVNGPADISLKYGYAEDPDNGKLSVVATPDSGADYDLTYQWYSNTADSNEDGILIDGATNATYIIPEGLDIGEHYYYCIVTATKKDDQNKKAATASEAATVTVVKAPAEISYPTSSVKIAFGDDFTNELTNTGDGAVSYVSSNTKVATVDSNGEVTIVGAGEAEITATAQEGTRYYYGSGDDTASYTLTVNKVTVNIDDWTYGDPAKQPSVTAAFGAATVQYTYYTDGSCTEMTKAADGAASEGKVPSYAGTYWIKAEIPATGNYAGAEGKDSFTINKKDVTITADSDTKEYDGTALTKDSYTNTALAAEDKFSSVTVTGSQIVAGKSDNVPSAAVIKNAADDDVTASYDITYKNGTLEVTQKAVTITAGDAEKVYDGTALTKDSYTNTALATGDKFSSVTVTGSQIVAGKSDNVPSAAVIKNAADDDVTASYDITYVNGTLEVTQNAVTITAESDTKVYDGTALTKDSFTNTELAEGDSIESVKVTGSQIVAGKSDNVPSAAVIKNAADDDVTASYDITYANGKLEVTQKAVTITADDAEKVYDGTALTKSTVTSDGLAAGDRIESVTVTGSQTVVGSSKNVPSGAKIVNESGEDVTASYIITYANGTLEVTKKSVTITAGSDTKEYDGTALTKDSFTNTELAEGDSIESVKVTGSQIVAGKSDNVPSAAVIKNAADDDVTASYDITYANGTLDVTRKSVTITADDAEKVYDGTALTKSTVTSDGLAAGDSIESVIVTGSQTVVGSSENVPSGAKIVNESGEDVTASYIITYANGTLEVTQKAVTITADSDTKVYDGTALTKDTVTWDDLAEGDNIETVTLTGSQIVVGSSENVPSDAVIVNAAGEDVTASYDITYANGTLEVTKKPVTITADSDTKVYDGTELTCDTYTNSELAEGDSIVSVTVTGSQTDAGSSDNIPSDAVITDGNGEIATDNYDIQYVNGKLEVTKKAVTVTTDDSSKIFGEHDPEFTFKTEGLVGEEALEGITLSREAGEDAGEYIISAESSEEKNTNYDITFDNKGKLTIAAKDVTPSVDKIEDKYYTGKEISPEMVVKDGEDIIPASEYTVKYKDNVETGKATAVISDVKGGNYNIAETTVNFNILPRGEVEVTEPAEENDCKGKLDEEETAVISKVELSADDQSALDTGKNVSIFLEVKTINDTVSAEDKAVVEETAKNNETGSELTVGWYIDVSLFKQIFGEDKVKITETNGVLGITIEIPESLRKDGRTFYVIRVHDGAGEIIPSKQEGNFISFTTDRFSTYALAYVDKTDADDASVKPADVKPADGSSAKSDDGLSEVHTGDDTNVLLIFLLMIDSGLAVVYFALQKKVKERRNR